MGTATTCEGVGARITERLARAVGRRRHAMWFDRSARFDYDEPSQTLTVAVPSRFVADWIGKHFADHLKQAASGEVGAPVSLDLRVDPAGFGSVRDRSEPARPASHGGNGTSRSVLRHELDTFVVGPSNALAYDGSVRVAEDEPGAARPLFVHGGCGLGKTHLLQGMCRRFTQRHPDAQVLYTTGERFTNEYITAVRAARLDFFRRRIRRLDLLAVDDVHFIASREKTQQEFLHSFDQIDVGGSRVAMASDSHPKLIKQFSEALVSRCVRGLVVRIDPPDAGTLVRLVEALSVRRGLRLAEGVAPRLAGRSEGSVRDIEGMLSKLHALAALEREDRTDCDVLPPIGRALVDRLFESEYSAPRRPVRFETIVNVVGEQLGVAAPQLLGRGRHRHVVLARALVVHLARSLTPMSFPEISAAMGRRNHSTVITASQRMERQLRADHPVHLPGRSSPTTAGQLVEQLQRRIARA